MSKLFFTCKALLKATLPIFSKIFLAYAMILVLLFIFVASIKLSVTFFEDENALRFRSLTGESTRREGALLTLEVPANQGNEPFDQAAWLSGKYPAKTEEVKKLIKQRLLEDKNMEELKQLLRGNTDKCATGDDWISCVFIPDLSLYDLVIEVREIKPNKVYFRFVS